MRTLAALLILSSAALAQDTYAPPDKELWDLMAKAIAELPMSLNAHNQAQQIIQNIQREAQMRAARAKALPPSPK